MGAAEEIVAHNWCCDPSPFEFIQREESRATVRPPMKKNPLLALFQNFFFFFVIGLGHALHATPESALSSCFYGRWAATGHAKRLDRLPSSLHSPMGRSWVLHLLWSQQEGSYRVQN